MVKKLTVWLILGALLLSVFGQVLAESRTPTANGIDVSRYQGKIDWDTVAPQIDFAVIRCGIGRNNENNDDAWWSYNVNACTRLKIPFGVYLCSYATTEEAIHSEADHVLRLVKGYDPTLPIYLDLETKVIRDNCTPEEILRLATIFCNRIKAAGYTPGVYANADWWENYLNFPEYDKWERWIAQTGSPLHYDRPYSMWQHSHKGRIKGIQGDVDLDYWYGKPFDQKCSHSYTSVVVKEPTCTEKGIREYTCIHCKHHYEERVAPTGHRYTQTVVPPTDCTDGYSIYTCHCSSSYIGESISSTEHVLDEGVITVLPTDREPGMKVYSCVKCGAPLLTSTIPATADHSSICPSVGYKDVPLHGHWAHEGIDYALIGGLFQGVSEDRFAPDAGMTRAMLVTVLWRRAGCPKAESPCEFLDVEPGAWYADAVAWAAEQGLVNGIGQRRFDPMGEVTREQFATILYRERGYATWSAIPESILGQFTDEEEISDYARGALAWAVYKGYITGRYDHGILLLDPRGTTTRAQAATIIGRLPK